MKVYTVFCGSAEIDKFTCFHGLENAPILTLQNREQAEQIACEFARKHPGESFYVAEGELLARYCAEPLPVTRTDL